MNYQSIRTILEANSYAVADRVEPAALKAAEPIGQSRVDRNHTIYPRAMKIEDVFKIKKPEAEKKKERDRDDDLTR